MVGITKFKQTFQDLARPNRFRVLIPDVLDSNTSMLCIQASIPAVSFNTDTFYNAADSMTIAPYEMPNDVLFTELNLTFMDTPTLDIRKGFDAWLEQVFEPSSGFGYLDDFKKSVTIQLLNRKGETTYTINCENCWPKSVDALPLDAAQANEFATFSAQLAFNYYEVQ